jgi:hypothetical protein
MFVYNFWRACSKSADVENSAALCMSRVCSMLQWSSEFICNCVISANRNYALLNWQEYVHDIYVDYIADQKKLCEIFFAEYKLRDEKMKRVYDSYSSILLSLSGKNSIMSVMMPRQCNQFVFCVYFFAAVANVVPNKNL